jgi:hypothetical protein
MTLERLLHLRVGPEGTSPVLQGEVELHVASADSQTPSMFSVRSGFVVEVPIPAARVGELSQPTLNDGESYEQLLADPSAFEDYDIDSARTQGYGFARVQRLALEHLLGVR